MPYPTPFTVNFHWNMHTDIIPSAGRRRRLGHASVADAACLIELGSDLTIFASIEQVIALRDALDDCISENHTVCVHCGESYRNDTAHGCLHMPEPIPERNSR